MASYTIELLNQVRNTTESKSDYAASKLLGITRQAASAYRNGIRQMDDDPAIKAAEILGFDPVNVLARLHAEKCRSDSARAVWERIGRMARATACITLAAGTIGLAGSPTAQSSPASPGSNSIYYVKLYLNHT